LITAIFNEIAYGKL